MPIQQNNYYADPALGAGIESLGRAIFGDPQNRVKNALAVAQGRYLGARTQDALADAQRKQAQLQALRSIGGDIGSALFGQAPGVPQDPAAIVAALPQLLGTAAMAYADKPEAIGQIFRVIGAASGDDALARRGMVATGVSPSEHFALTPERADDIRAQGYRNDQTLEGMRQSGALQRERIASSDRRYSADQQLAGTRYTADQNRAGAWDRELVQSGDRRYTADQSLVGTIYTADQSRAGALERENIASSDRRYATDKESADKRYAVDNSQDGVKAGIIRDVYAANPGIGMSFLYDPVEVSPGATALFAPGDPRFPQGAPGDMGSLFTAPDQPRADRYVVSPNAAGGYEYQPVRPGLAAPTPAGERDRDLPREVSPQEAKALDDLVGFMAPDGATIGSADRARVLSRATAIYQRPQREGGGNAQVAVHQAWNEIFGANPRVEGEWNPFKANRVVPAAPAPQQAPAPAQAPAPQQAAVPPPAQRVPGRVYETPRGPMVWTGTGWLPAPAQAGAQKPDA